MCTVTLVPILDEKNGFILTSNRDEATERETTAPNYYFLNSKKLLFPKDEVGGGTWIGVGETNRVICLLNGAFEPHKRAESYEKSRGLVVMEFLASEDLKTLFSEYNFSRIEPFTMIIVDFEEQLEFTELVWDGKKKHLQKLELTTHIWSSSPLYTSEMKDERHEWFFKFKKEGELSASRLWEFHHTAGTGDKNKDLIIDRGFLKTRSITQVEKTSKKLIMRYEDLEKGKISEENFRIN